MSKLTEELSNHGCDMKVTLERFLGDEDFYEKCLREMLNDSSFEELGKAIEANDVKAAFESAHTLKGLASNIGLDPMLDIVVELVEPLRNGILDGMDVIYLKLMEEKKEYDKFLDA